MLPLLGILSALSLIDRSNLGLARTAGMDHDLVSLFSTVNLIGFGRLMLMAPHLSRNYTSEHAIASQLACISCLTLCCALSICSSSQPTLIVAGFLQSASE